MKVIYLAFAYIVLMLLNYLIYLFDIFKEQYTRSQGLPYTEGQINIFYLISAIITIWLIGSLYYVMKKDKITKNEK